MYKAIFNSLDEIPDVAKQFIEAFKNQRVFAFYGEMGVGKTTFVKALCKELGVADYVNSPTFAIINEYETQEKDVLYHFDFYRIEDVQEAYNLGYEDYFFSDNYCFIEWPERVEELLPDDTIRVHIVELENGVREVQVKEM